jgi:NitT/TauT family transport system permease protein
LSASETQIAGGVATAGTPDAPGDAANVERSAGRVATAALSAGEMGGTARPDMPVSRSWLVAFLPVLASGIGLAVHRWVPNQQATDVSGLYARFLLGVLAAGLVLGFTQRLWRQSNLNWRRPFHLPLAAFSNVMRWSVLNADVLATGVLLACAWELITLKFNLMPLPYFPGPDAVVRTLVADWSSTGRGQPGLSECMWQSLLLLLKGYLTGSTLGVTFGVLVGWFPQARRWGMPVLKLIGPIPATAFIPLTLMVFPSAGLSAVALVALAVWFPVTMLTMSGVSSVRASHLDVARTLGAGPAYLIFRVAIPSALPNIFVGLFMGLGASFLTLIVAEAVGVQAGLGWYIDWARAYSDYRKVYAALIIMAVYFSAIMTLLFKLRDWVLVWQKGVIKW